jgi:predicted RNA binding protein YcfA (HicA-like mRNA interferase family)
VRIRKVLDRAIVNPASLSFAELVALAGAFGFRLSRVSGSHHIFSRPGVSELVNLQNVRGRAKPYQVRQLLKLVERHDLRLED